MYFVFSTYARLRNNKAEACVYVVRGRRQVAEQTLVRVKAHSNDDQTICACSTYIGTRGHARCNLGRDSIRKENECNGVLVSADCILLSSCMYARIGHELRIHTHLGKHERDHNDMRATRITGSLSHALQLVVSNRDSIDIGRRFVDVDPATFSRCRMQTASGSG